MPINLIYLVAFISDRSYVNMRIIKPQWNILAQIQQVWRNACNLRPAVHILAFECNFEKCLLLSLPKLNNRLWPHKERAHGDFWYNHIIHFSQILAVALSNLSQIFLRWLVTLFKLKKPWLVIIIVALLF